VNFSKVLLTSVAGLVFVPAAFGQAGPTITVVPTLAPNVYGSPSWGDWVTNSITALENNQSSYGDPTSPTYYQAQSTVSATQTIVTGFPSWLGSADPSSVYGSAFANELGNRMTFGLVVNGNGTQFSISQLGFSAASNDSGDALGFGYGAGSYGYSANYVGVISSDNNIYDLSSDTFITSGSSDQMVNGIFGRGSGNSFEPDDDPCAGCTLAQQQADINYTADEDFYQTGLSQFTGTYYLTNSTQANAFATGSGSFDIVTPEPSTWLLMLTALSALVILHRRRAANV